jgi:hypothetical protein
LDVFLRPLEPGNFAPERLVRYRQLSHAFLNAQSQLVIFGMAAPLGGTG